ncbi:NAD(P)-dependent oxidoreductase [Rhodohalobacter sp. SW132]|uniref:NAD-dependent epimerase/dehydratase family protein n=1 Tax=Rhodohalobacter sp. SW132 TaxID=2293433 RepID=UPI000E27528F|nr:NAD(P)-dependent oxidoreductase [Rhodohalobacter sp. SW132]REL24183.1 NAD(P)-dependent oxidoreductase [Rhodohalobacter sp. SW132]
MNKVLVTGATGFIGRHTLKKLCDRFDHVYAVYRNESLAVANDNLTWHEADLLSDEETCALFEECAPTHLLHLAWYAEHGKYGHSEKNIDWLTSSLHLIREFRKNGGKRVICAGTCFEYNLDHGTLSETDTPLEPELIYGESKKSLYNMLSSYSELTGLSSAWGRVFYLYGPHENPGRLVSSVIRSLILNQPAKSSAGEQKKDFLHVYDVADAFVELLSSNLTGAVNIGSGNAIAVKDIVIKIGAFTGKEHLVELGALPTRQNERQLIQADTQRLTHELNWHPGYTLDEGLKQTIQWWEDHLDLDNEALKNAI